MDREERLILAQRAIDALRETTIAPPVACVPAPVIGRTPVVLVSSERETGGATLTARIARCSTWTP